MNKKKILLISAIVLLMLLIGTIIFILTRNKNKELINPQVSQPTKKIIKEELVKWEDPLGFIFKYPEDLKIDPHDEDLDNYAHVELTSDSHAGGIIIWAKDFPEETLDDWISSDREASMASLMESTLDRQPAKKWLVNAKDKKIMTAAIYDNLLFLIETNLGKDNFWQKINDTVVSSFSFGTVAGEVQTDLEDNSAGYESSEEEIQGEFEGEEVIE